MLSTVNGKYSNMGHKYIQIYANMGHKYICKYGSQIKLPPPLENGGHSQTTKQAPPRFYCLSYFLETLSQPGYLSEIRHQWII